MFVTFVTMFLSVKPVFECVYVAEENAASIVEREDEAREDALFRRLLALKALQTLLKEPRAARYAQWMTQAKGRLYLQQCASLQINNISSRLSLAVGTCIMLLMHKWNDCYQ